MRGEQRIGGLAERRGGGGRLATPILVLAFIGAFSPWPVLPSFPPRFSLALLSVGEDLPARQALSMETQMPVSRARSTREAKSPLRWGTMEAVGAKQGRGRVRSLL